MGILINVGGQSDPDHFDVKYWCSILTQGRQQQCFQVFQVFQVSKNNKYVSKSLTCTYKQLNMVQIQFHINLKSIQEPRIYISIELLHPVTVHNQHTHSSTLIKSRNLWSKCLQCSHFHPTSKI